MDNKQNIDNKVKTQSFQIIVHFTIIYTVNVIHMHFIFVVEILHNDLLLYIISALLYVQGHHIGRLKSAMMGVRSTWNSTKKPSTDQDLICFVHCLDF